jgi:hypothetical protein
MSYNELLMLSTNLSNAAGGKKGVSDVIEAALLALTILSKAVMSATCHGTFNKRLLVGFWECLCREANPG